MVQTFEDDVLAEPANWWHVGVPALVSAGVHFTLLLVFSLATLNYLDGEPAGEEVLIGHLEGEQLSDVPEDALDRTAVEPSPQQTSELEEAFEIGPPELSSQNQGMDVQIAAVTPSGAGEGLAGLDAIVGSGGSGAGGGNLTFLGTRAKGKRFCIIADRSGSMSGKKVEFVKEEILETLSTMKSGMRIQLVFFHSRAQPFPRTDWLHPRRDRPDIEQWLAGISGSGGTDPTPAFAFAFQLDPRPDLIFFMTDGQFGSHVVQDVARRNSAGRRAVIHTISFVDRSAEKMLREIAEMSGGTYRHVAGF